ncbi:hypothetical protein ACIQ7Q_24875 [Streptomyces sp. NPDC096176]|uniref:hypothetical protein n=1 Tax=Streptomyces sp. NPDC096176 TaxID=3366079 RepID=UPI0037F4AE4E
MSGRDTTIGALDDRRCDRICSGAANFMAARMGAGTDVNDEQDFIAVRLGGEE